MAPTGTGEAFPVCHWQLRSCCTPLPGALPSAPALMVPNAQNLEIPPKEGERQPAQSMLVLHPSPALVSFCVVAASTRFCAQISHPAQQWPQLHQSQFSQQQMFAKKSPSREKNFTSSQFKGTAWRKAAGTRSLQIMVFPGKLLLHTLIRHELILGAIKTEICICCFLFPK